LEGVLRGMGGGFVHTHTHKDRGGIDTIRKMLVAAVSSAAKERGTYHCFSRGHRTTKKSLIRRSLFYITNLDIPYITNLDKLVNLEAEPYPLPIFLLNQKKNGGKNRTV